jgi:hypothetical protein
MLSMDLDCIFWKLIIPLNILAPVFLFFISTFNVIFYFLFGVDVIVVTGKRSAVS